MRKIAFICVIIFAAVNIAFILPSNKSATEEKETQYIDWAHHDRLEWTNFTGKAKTWSNISALTASAIEYAYECDGHDVHVKAKAIFIPEESWVQHDAKTEYILAHEQLHFDITEIYARKLRMQLKKEVKDCDDIPKIKKIADKIMDEWKQEQKEYDTHTRHSMNKETQAMWLEKVAKDLEYYAKYALRK